ncbi:MAG TPA: hypothetical protein VGL29_07880 [Blastocatellia bacterium]
MTPITIGLEDRADLFFEELDAFTRWLLLLLRTDGARRKMQAEEIGSDK